jgi:hypothetical protein
MSDIYEFLRDVRERPGMYVLDYSLEPLQSMCHGYSVALEAHGIHELGVDFNRRFSDFVYEQRGWSMSIGWADGIRRHAKSNEEAFQTFFALLELFRAIQAQ